MPKSGWKRVFVAVVADVAVVAIVSEEKILCAKILRTPSQSCCFSSHPRYSLMPIGTV